MSMLRRGDELGDGNGSLQHTLEPSEIELIELISQFPNCCSSSLGRE